LCIADVICRENSELVVEHLPVLSSVSAERCQVHFWHSQDSCWCSQGLSELYSI